MSSHRIASRYAKSLLDLGLETDSIESIYDDIQVLKSSFENRDLYLLLKSPIIKADKKIKVLDAIFSDTLGKTTEAFLKICINKGREKFLPEIIDDFIYQYKKFKKISTVKLRTAVPLSGEKIEQIKQKLLLSNETDQFIELTTEVDKSLIGGFVIEVENKQYDASIAYNLDKVKKSFKDNKYIKSS